MYNMYSIFDKVTNLYSFPFAQQNDAAAKRYFLHVVQGNEMASPDDFELYLVGTFDQSCAAFVPCERSFICRGE